jgi:predicted aspartyl protease
MLSARPRASTTGCRFVDDAAVPCAGARSEEITAVVLADGRRAARQVGDAVVTVNDDSTPCRVVFGESGDASILGRTVLEQLGLAVDPVQRRLVSTDVLFYAFS